MTFRLSRLKKVILIILGIVFLLIILVIAFASPLAKYLVEKYDEKYTGRKIEIGGSYLNPFTGHVNFSDVNIYEYKSDSVFLSMENLSADFAMLKMVSGTYEISEITLDRPKGIVIQNKRELNFDDIIKKFQPKDTVDKKGDPVHFNLLNIKIKDGIFTYNEKVIPVRYSIREVNIESEGLRWDVDTMPVKFSFIPPGEGSGDLKGNITINVDNSNYRLAAIANKFNLKFLEQYLKDLSNYGNFEANLDADVHARGNFKDAQNINAEGIIAINDLHVGEKAHDYVSFKKFTVRMRQLSPKAKKYLIDSISLNKLFVEYERYDYLNNIEMMFGKKGSKAAEGINEAGDANLIVKIGQYVAELAKNFFKSDYSINRLAIYDGNLKYNDYSLTEKFSISASPVYIIADSIKRDNKPVDFSFKTGIQPYGNVSVKISINPKDSSDFDISYHFDDLPASMFNPYMSTYTSFALNRGTIELKGDWTVRNGKIKSNNRLLIIDPRLNERINKDDRKWLPMRAIMFFVRERGNVIDYQVPITGDLKDPKFHFRDVILDVLKNIFVKPPTSPYISEVRSVEQQIEKSLILRWQMGQSTLSGDQFELLENLSHILAENPSLKVNVDPIIYGEKEKENILLIEAKKKYFLFTNNRKANSLSKEDSLNIQEMSIKDSSFIKFLDKRSGKKKLFTVQAKCTAFLGEKYINDKFKELLKAREKAFMFYFKENLVSERIKMNEFADKIPYNGFSFYKIDYNGKQPPELVEAFERMKELNEINPRKKYKNERAERRNLIRAKNKKKK